MRLLSFTAQERIVVVSGRLVHENWCHRVGAHWFEVRAHAELTYTLKRTDNIAEMSHRALGLCFAHAAAAFQRLQMAGGAACALHLQYVRILHSLAVCSRRYIAAAVTQSADDVHAS